jgi:hypothetical protein
VGYHVHQTGGKFTIRAANAVEALAALVKAGKAEPALCERGTPSEQLRAAFDAWRWRLDLDEITGDVMDAQFEGRKDVNFEALFRVIAPFVESGSWIAMAGEDDEYWRWYFDGRELDTQPGTVVYEDVRVVVEIRGGVVSVKECPPGISIAIVNHDNEEERQRADRAA